jgi:hypothetical protein
MEMLYPLFSLHFRHLEDKSKIFRNVARRPLCSRSDHDLHLYIVNLQHTKTFR